MTVPSATNKSGPYTGNGVTTVFPYGFRILDASHIQVVRTEGGVDTVLTSGFTVSGVGVGGGGNITFSVAPTALQKITLIRNAPFTQSTDLENQGSYYAETIEDALDLAAMRDQQLKEQLDRSLKLPPTVAGANSQLPSPAPNAVLGWNESGTALQNVGAQTLATIVASGTAAFDTFVGNGSSQVFVLSENPGSLANLDVSVNGVTLVPNDDYFWTGGLSLSFAVVPANGDEILVRYVLALSQDSVLASLDREAGFTSRALFVSANSANPGLGLSDGQVVRADGFEYKRLASATVFSDLPGWIPNGGLIPSPFVRLGRDWAYVSQWGAVGDGTGNDGDALNAALTACAYVKGEPGAVYRCTETVTIPSNRRFDFGGAKMVRGAYGTLGVMQWLLQTERATTTWDAQNIILEDVNVEDDGPATRGQGVLLIGDNIKVRGYRLKFAAPYDATVGAWSNYISGNNISFTGDIDVDTLGAGLWSDCFHLGYVKNFVLGAHNCRGGDDAIALYGTARSYSWAGRNLAAENITILPGYSESLTSHAIRVGAQGYFSPVENESPANLVFKNVNFVNETIGNPTYTPITLEDLRGTGFITGKHDNIYIKATIADQTAAMRLLSMFGNPDVFNAANRAQHNFGRVRVEIEGMQATASGAEAAQLVYGGGVDRLEMSGDLAAEIAGSGTLNQCTILQVDDLQLSGLRVKSDTTANLFNIAYLRRLFLDDCEIGNDGQNEFATFKIDLNADQATSVYLRGGRITSTDRVFNITGTGLMGDFHILDTVLSGTFPSADLPSFAGVTTWSGSVILDPAIGIRTTVAGLLGSGIPVAQGCRAVVTDANATTPGGVVAGGGANIVPVFRDGTAWRIG